VIQLEQRRVVFSGQVQGVGFRYTARRLAGRFDVTGYVRNLADGRVECVIEGPGRQIADFVESLSIRMGQYIDHVQEDKQPYSGNYDTFDVKF